MLSVYLCQFDEIHGADWGEGLFKLQTDLQGGRLQKSVLHLCLPLQVVSNRWQQRFTVAFYPFLLNLKHLTYIYSHLSDE